MYARQTTPPSATSAFMPGSVDSTSDAAFWSEEYSPASAITANTTPPRSPYYRQNGPLLLPKVRLQDQISEPTTGPVRHRRTTSTASSGYSSVYSPYARPNSQMRRSSSPFSHLLNNSTLTSPSSATYDLSGWGLGSTLNSPINLSSDSRCASVSGHARPRSVSAHRHARGVSAGSIDENIINRYGYPTYRNFPTYMTSSMTAQPSLHLNTSLPMASSQVEEVSFDGTSTYDFALGDLDTTSMQYPYTQETAFPNYEASPTSTLLDYLSGPNPSPALVHRVPTAQRDVPHFWWDVRNLRSWADFNIDTITSLPSILPLLEVPVSTALLPEPARINSQPEDQMALHDICDGHYANKVNTALEVATGQTHIIMRGNRPLPTIRRPDFVSSYPSEHSKTFSGEPRGRVVGLVKCYEQWNTGMRSETAPRQVLYLEGLAHLQRVMREHGCRYGFIITEIELLCVRAGAPLEAVAYDASLSAADTSTPLFGYLETSAPISLATSGRHPSTGALQMTAGLALWFLHMLARETALPGMASWRMDVGGPAACSRKNHLDKDAWIPKPQLRETRDAKRVRGWVFPHEPFSKRECGGVKRRRAA